MNIKSTLNLVSICSLFAVTLAHADPLNLSPNPQFELSSVPYGSYQYHSNPAFSAANWIFSGATGIANHSLAWGGQGYYGTVAYIQNNSDPANHPSVSQVITSNGKNFSISFALARRPGFGVGSVSVYWDNQLIGENLIPESTDFTSYTYSTPGLPMGTHILTFRGVATSSDASLFLDNVSISSDF